MRTNVLFAQPAPKTAEGATASRINPEEQLRRLVMSCMLWEDNFYVDGKTVGEQIAEAVKSVSPAFAEKVAADARSKGNLRHVPLLVVREMFRDPTKRMAAASALFDVVQRPDEMGEFLSIYWKDGKTPIPSGAKRALAMAFQKFTAYQLGKYNSDAAKVKLKDVIRIVHPKPADESQSALWKSVLDGTLESPDTWEVALSAGGKKTNEEKRETFERLIGEKKLGALALLRNLRNCTEWGVETSVLKSALSEMDSTRVLPFRFIAAAKHAPSLEPEIEIPMLASARAIPKMSGKTVILVDVSGSMDHPISAKSQMTRMDAACGIAIIAREMFEDVQILSFSAMLATIPPRHGFALRDAIVSSQPHGSTFLAQALARISGYDRIVIVTDEQSHDGIIGRPQGKAGYVINVGSDKNGVGYGAWTHIDGFSEATLQFIAALEGSNDS